jgi:NAD(P)-dependent dehydrogenase (short-subunit alcohol dehydrogenase family)
MKNLKKIGLVTGGSRGLGRDMAIGLAKKGHDVVFTFAGNRTEADLTLKLVEEAGGKCAALQLDLRNLNTLDTFIVELINTLKETFGAGKFDFLINNAGMGGTIPFEKATEQDFDAFLNVHYKGVYFLTQKCLPILNDGSSIVNISTGTTRFANPGYSIYASMKGAVEVFTKYLAKELGARGIRANVVAPGPVETDFNNAAIRSNPQMKTILSGLSPLGRVGQADDIGSVVAFLCSEDAKWINGQRIEVSGGINV